MEKEQTDLATIIEITDDNFESEFPHIQKAIFESTFVAFDMEFSGMDIHSYYKSVSVDTVVVLFSAYS